jgi:hypothetical protein
MHQKEQYKSAVDAHMHEPPEKVLFEDPAIEDYIENEDLHEREKPCAEKC